MKLSLKDYINAKSPIHLVGIGGVSMSALAELLLSLGVPVSGSDRARSTLTERGATRADDRISEAAMEDRKKDGYF